LIYVLSSSRIEGLTYNRNSVMTPCPEDKEEYLWAVARYIENNPVRAKIVEKAESWKWSSARAYIIGEHEELLILMSG
jgi:hypothetical protein